MTTKPTPITDVRTEVYEFPTESGPESDGTLTWDKTTAVVVHISAGGQTGLGWTYSGPAAASLVNSALADVVRDSDPFDIPRCWESMVRACRNLGRPGVVSQAIAAVDIALWDLKARLLGVPLHRLFGAAHNSVPVYGSGGFTNLSDDQLESQVSQWLSAGCTAVKIKVAQDWGHAIGRDMQRLALLKSWLPDDVLPMVDANGGYTPGQAVRLGAVYDSMGVVWFEEPVSSDDLTTLAMLRGRLGADVAAGEYADSTQYVQRMCAAAAVDCLQVDVTRCAGYTEWLRCAAIAASYGLQISGHCAPSLHAPVAAAVPNLRHVEWFIDHARLEPLLVEGCPEVRHGVLQLSDEPGHGMRLAASAERCLV